MVISSQACFPHGFVSGISPTAMSEKKAKGNCEKRKKAISLEVKREIIDKHEQGVRVIDLATEYDRSTSTICTILKQKDSIRAITPAKGVKIISKLRNSVHEKMENLLLVWLKEKQLTGDTLTESIICEKARSIYSDLRQQTPGTSAQEASHEQFKASRGWFENFRKRTGIHSVLRHSDSNDFVKTFAELMEGKDQPPENENDDWKSNGLKEKQEIPWRTNPNAWVTRQFFMQWASLLFGPTVGLNNLLQRDLEGTGSEEEAPDERNIEDLVAAHSEDLTTEELHQVLEETSKTTEQEAISSREIREVLAMWDRLSEFVEKNHPDKVATSRAAILFNETCLTHFRDILEKMEMDDDCEEKKRKINVEES